MLAKFAPTARQRLRLPGAGYRCDQLRALARRVEVSDGEVRIMGSKSDLLRTLAADGSGTSPGAVPSFAPKCGLFQQTHQEGAQPNTSPPADRMSSIIFSANVWAFL
jgi:hypothetical protein